MYLISTELSDYARRDLSEDFITDLSIGTDSIFPPHVDSNSLLLEIKQGKYLMGRLQVSRFNIEEATVHINGITNDVLIKGKENMNRGLNMDIVAVQLLPENEWIEKGIRSEAIVTDVLEKVVNENVEEDEEKDDEFLNLAERLNNSEKQPTAKVVGIVQGIWFV